MEMIKIRMSLAIVVAMASMATALPASAEGDMPHGVDKQKWMERAEQRFQQADSNSDGKVDRSEFKSAREHARERRQERRENRQERKAAGGS